MAGSPLLVVLAGPSGSGKSTLCDRLVDANVGFKRVVTTTTRPPRDGETDGIHYHFFTPEEFTRRAAAGEFLEWAWVHGLPTEASERRYGTLRTSVLEPLRAGQDLVMSIDVQGVANFRRAARTDRLLASALLTVFIRVDHERLLARMRSRGKDNDAEIARRMKTAEAELRAADTFDHVIESRTRDDDFAALQEIIRLRRSQSGTPGSGD
ncbi:MAG TPA: guanylate kinase [Opitutaceae bacterium]|jgi:guanylate kinase|nr:guanylate kinase [Opitutaceae bacterium]